MSLIEPKYVSSVNYSNYRSVAIASYSFIGSGDRTLRCCSNDWDLKCAVDELLIRHAFREIFGFFPVMNNRYHRAEIAAAYNVLYGRSQFN